MQASSVFSLTNKSHLARDTLALVVNGIAVTPEHVGRQREILASLFLPKFNSSKKAFRASVNFVPNLPKEMPQVFFLKGKPYPKPLAYLTRCAAGFISPRLGIKTEKIVSDLVARIENEYREFKDIFLVVHSHGSIVTSNSLAILREKLSPEEWQQLTKKTKVFSMGSGIHDWPEGIKAYSFEIEGDKTVQNTHKLSQWRREVIENIVNGVENTAPILSREQRFLQVISKIVRSRLSPESLEYLKKLKEVPAKVFRIPAIPHLLHNNSCHTPASYVNHFPYFLARFLRHVDPDSNGKTLFAQIVRSHVFDRRVMNKVRSLLSTS
jgi:hypothetical protein